MTKRNQITNFRNLAAQFFLGSIALALVTLIFFRLGVDLASTGFVYLIVVVLLSLMGSFIASALLAVLAVASLVYFFAPPIFDLRVDDPRHYVVVVAFLLTSLIVMCLIRSARERTVSALQAEANLRISEADLRDSEKQWREFFEHNPVMYFMIDATGTVLSVNTFGATQLGYSAADLVGQSVLSVFLEKDRDVAWRNIAACLKTIGQTHIWEIRKVRKDGSVLWVRENAKAIRRANGQLILLMACEDVTERKKTESALQQSEAYLAEAQQLSHTGNWAWDVRLQEFAYRSAGVYQLFGFDPEESALPLQAFRDRIFPEDRLRNVEAASRAVREKKDFEVDFRVALPDGSTKRIHTVGHPVVNSDGEVIELIGTHVDVTEQYAAKEALQKAFDEIRKSEDRLRLVIDTIPTLVWRAGSDGVPDFLNQPALDYTGISLDQAAIAWPRAFHPDDKKGMLVKWSAIQASGMRGELEARLRRSDGEYRWFLFRAEPLRDGMGNIVTWYGSSTDIEDRKRAELALRESEQRFRDYAETGSDWLWETGPDHRIIGVSEHVNAVGIEPSRITGVARWDTATDVESEPEKWRLHQAAHDERQPFRDFVYCTVSASGSPVYIRSSGKPFFDADGNFLGYRGTGTDVTATIRADRAEQALRKAQAELAHVTRVTTLGELTASIAHEVNQPLAAVIANADACLRWLDRSPPDLAAARRSVEWVVNDGNRASEVIRRVRALVSKTDIEKVQLDVNNVVREVIALVQGELSSHRVSLRTELAQALPTILGDRVQLQQVIINLVVNGIEAMEPVTDRQRELVIRSGRDETGRVLLSVTDCGVGISAENANRMFNAFFTTKFSGMGMGLSICRSIVEAHGGHLSVFGNKGHGATFQFVLPLYQEEACDRSRQVIA